MFKHILILAFAVVLSGCSNQHVKCEAYYKKNGVVYKANVLEVTDTKFMVAPITAYGSFWAPKAFFTEGNTCNL